MAVDTFSERVQNNLGYLNYQTMLNQSGASAPDSNGSTTGSFINTTGATLTWARAAPGVYTLTSSVAGLFVVAKTAIIIPDQVQSIGNPTTTGAGFVNLVNFNTTTILFFATTETLAFDDPDGSMVQVSAFKTAPEDDLLINKFFEIRIFP